MRLTSASDANGLTLNICSQGVQSRCRTIESRAARGVHGEVQRRLATMTTAVLFDFNGVLVDDEDVHFEAFRRTLAVRGITITHAIYRRYLGYDDRGTIVALLAH